MDREISARDTIDGMKLGWAFGAMLYEINALPFHFIGKKLADTWHQYFYAALAAAVMAATGMLLSIGWSRYKFADRGTYKLLPPTRNDDSGNAGGGLEMTVSSAEGEPRIV